MHSYMHFLKIIKQKQNQVLYIHKCILYFFFKKKNKIKKTKRTHTFKHAFFIRKIHKVSSIHKCTLQKE